MFINPLPLEGEGKKILNPINPYYHLHNHEEFTMKDLLD